MAIIIIIATIAVTRVGTIASNKDVIDLYGRVAIGTRTIVLPNRVAPVI